MHSNVQGENKEKRKRSRKFIILKVEEWFNIFVVYCGYIERFFVCPFYGHPFASIISGYFSSFCSILGSSK